MASGSARHDDAPATSNVSLVSAADTERIYAALLSSGCFSREQIAEQAGLAVAMATAEQYPVSAATPTDLAAGPCDSSHIRNVCTEG